MDFSANTYSYVDIVRNLSNDNLQHILGMNPIYTAHGKMILATTVTRNFSPNSTIETVLPVSETPTTGNI